MSQSTLTHQPSTAVRASLTVNGCTLAGIFQAAGSLLQEGLLAEMTQILRAQGYVVELPNKWETPKELSARIGISQHKFCYRIKHPACPKPQDVIRDGHGIKCLRSHTVLDHFLCNHRNIP